MFFAGVSIFVLSGLVMLVGISVYLIGWVFSFNPSTLESLGKIIKVSIFCGIVGIFFTVSGGGSL